MGACCSAQYDDVADPAKQPVVVADIRSVAKTMLEQRSSGEKMKGGAAADLNLITPEIKAASSRHSTGGPSSCASGWGESSEDDGCTTFASLSINSETGIVSPEEFKKVISTKPSNFLTEVTVFSHNLQWWSLFGFKNGNKGSATRLLRATLPDIAGWQECEDVSRILGTQGLLADYRGIQGRFSLAFAYKFTDWDVIADGFEEVATDEEEQFSGPRGVIWARFRHRRSSKVVFAINHFGPMRVNSGGKAGGATTAGKIATVIYRCAQPGDGVVLFGTFNSQAQSRTVRHLERYLFKVWTGSVYGGIDHVFSSLPVDHAQNLSKGGSDHEAVAITFLL
mmetsp:Transcript_20242/g.44201  ORF Transcript_20242/g.44201 Transcript_20242/m.44201 type:complete len:338 (-) Transcript_20242:77-1090(-)